MGQAGPGIVVTNAHVAVHGELSVVDRDGVRAAARVLAIDEQVDAAVLGPACAPPRWATPDR